MAYSYLTFTNAKVALSNRLGDPGFVYWTNTEMGLYIIEALRTWGLLTGYWRDSGVFATVASTGLYNINTIQNTAAENLLSFTVTDTELSTMIQYHLLEPATGSTWTGSEQFTLADITNSLTKRRDELLLETGCFVTSTPYILGTGTNNLDVADTTLMVRRMQWTGAVSGVAWPLYPEDISNQRNYDSGYLTTQDTPQTYSSSSAVPLRYIIAPPPDQPGTFSLLNILSGTALTAQGVVVGVPDDMTPIIKWGALADMLGKEGPAQDLGRSYFCERRWKLGLELAKINATVVNVEINGQSLTPESISSLDQYSPSWMTSTGTPSLVGSMRNYLALAPCPDGVYSVLLDVVRKAVVPTAGGDFIQVGREYIDIILDYAEHLAAFKSGGQEFRHTYRAAENFFNACLGYNQRLAAAHPNIVELIRQSTIDDYVLPMKKRAGNKPLEQFQSDDVQAK